VRFLAAAFVAAFAGCTPAPQPSLPEGEAAPASPDAPATVTATTPPPAPREFRAAWIATVANIDWPSKPGLPVAVQQDEARRLVRAARAAGLNALVLQVRPAADAIYPSNLEPWSEYLTGTQGRAPDPAWDPLAYWIAEAHASGLELHAWFNPLRARHSAAKSPIAPGHVSRTNPAIVKSYGNQLWMDPGERAAADRFIAVVRDVLARYDVDGVHIDDYFYPYPVALNGGPADGGPELDFPDEPSWRAHLDAGGTLSRADWRRRNVDLLMERFYLEAHQAKPTVRVGVSPFGLGRPDRRPPGITGFSQYDKMYADVEKWLAAGWLDYLAPQLYWPRESAGQPFGTLLDYWSAQNAIGRHVWPGLFTSRIDATDRSWLPEEIAGQVELARARGASGHLHFSLIAIAQNRKGIADRLAALYATPALVPATPWLREPAPPAPQAKLVDADPGFARLVFDNEEPRGVIAAWGRYGTSWRFFALAPADRRLPAAWGGQRLGLVVVSALGRTGVESPRARALEARRDAP